jgi:hypothetical protein
MCNATKLTTEWQRWINRVISRVSWWRLLNPNDRIYLTGIGDSESCHRDYLQCLALAGSGSSRSDF